MKITFKRIWAYGGDRREDDTDYVCGYQASNGAMIEKKFADGLNVYCWKIGRDYYDTLSAAKDAVIRKSNEPASTPETDTAAETETASENVSETATETDATEQATAIARLTRRVKRETGDNIRDCFEAIAEGHDAALEAIAAMEKEAGDYINAVTARFCADGAEVEPETADENETNATEATREPVKFEVGREYKCGFGNGVNRVRIAERTENTVAYVGNWSGCRVCRSLLHVRHGVECICTDIHGVFTATDTNETATADEAANATDTATDNKAAAMTAQEITARKMIHEQTTEYLLRTFEDTTTNNDLLIPTVRGWLMDELQSRYPEAFDKWLDSEVCEDDALREYINAEIQAEQAATEAADSGAGQSAPQGDDVSEETRKFVFYVGRHNEMMNDAHISSLKRDSAAEMDYLRAADRLYKVICNSEARLRNAGAEVRRTDSDYPWYHITGVTVNGRAVYPEAAPEGAPAPQEPEAVTENVPAPEFDYDFLEARYAVFEFKYGAFSNEFETDSFRGARERLKEEWDGAMESGDWGLFDRDARQYIRIRATPKGRKAFKAENARLAAKAAPQEPDATPEPVSDADGAETETIELHDDIDTYAVCEKNGITWTRVNADTLAIRADDYRRLLDGAVNQRYIRNLRRDSNTGRFCGGTFTLAGTIAR